MENFAWLALLACPIGMGLMMLFMGKGMKGMRGAKEDSVRQAEVRPEPPRSDEQERDPVGAGR